MQIELANLIEILSFARGTVAAGNKDKCGLVRLPLSRASRRVSINKLNGSDADCRNLSAASSGRFRFVLRDVPSRRVLGLRVGLTHVR